MGKIRVGEPVLNGRQLTCKVSTTEGLEKYLNDSELFIEYDTDVVNDPSILNIPLTATILPLAWLTGSDVIVGALDKTFKHSMDKLQKLFKEMFPLAKFTTEIKAKELVDNKIKVFDPERRTGLLFSGGVDSTYSLIKNLEKKPRLIMHWGVDNFLYPDRNDHWEKTISTYKEFAEKNNLAFNLVKTNISQILDDRRIEHRFHGELYDGKLRFALQHSLVLLPLVAPLSMNKFDALIIAASDTPQWDYVIRPRAAKPSTDELIIWGDLKVEHHGYISRNEKIKTIADYQRDNDLILRVCLRSTLTDGNFNDSTCEKCLRTIASLALMGVDPNSCGFKVDESTFNLMRSFWVNRKTSLLAPVWRELQALIPNEIDNDFNGSKNFFEWFKDFDFESAEKTWFYTDLYMALPYKLASLLDVIYRKLGINVHENPRQRL